MFLFMPFRFAGFGSPKAFPKVCFVEMFWKLLCTCCKSEMQPLSREALFLGVLRVSKLKLFGLLFLSAALGSIREEILPDFDKFGVLLDARLNSLGSFLTLVFSFISVAKS